MTFKRKFIELVRESQFVGIVDMYNVLASRNVLVRSATLWVLGFASMLLAWSISFRTLPDGALSGKLLVSQVDIITQELSSTFSRILAYNLLFAFTPIVIANLVKVKGLPLGYLLVPYHWILFGMLLGTNSFANPSPSRLFPTINILFHGVGIYEITAYTLIAATTYALTIHSKRDRLHLRIDGLPSSEKVVFIVSMLLLVLSNFVEAWQIIA